MAEDLEERLFDKREELVGLAEAYGYGHLFKSTQSIGDMEKNIKNISDDEIKKELLEMFDELEELYNEYTIDTIEDVLNE